MARPPKEIGGWILLTEIGSGGQSHVWRAVREEGRSTGGTAGQPVVGDVWREGNEPRALKLLRLKDSKKARRFAQEARVHFALSSQRAPHIATILDHNLDEVEKGGHPWGYLVLPLAECPLDDDDVAATLKGRLELCLEVFEGIVEGAAAAHRAGVVHRDLKPGNILFPDRTLKNPLISDFGICFLKSEDDRVTSVNETVGAKYFMAPEQERGGIVDVKPAADVYALGKLLCFMLTGRYVYREDYGSIISEKEIAEEPRLIVVRDKVLAVTIVESATSRLPSASDLLKVVREVRHAIKGPTPGSPAGGTGGSGLSQAKASFEDHGAKIVLGRGRELLLELDALRQAFDADWSQLHEEIRTSPDKAEQAAHDLIVRQGKSIGLALAIARFDEVDLFPALKAFIEAIVGASEGLSGYPAIIGVPHVLAGFLYMSTAVMAMKSHSWKILALLMSKKFQWAHQADKRLFSYGFALHPFFHSHAFAHKADKIHDFFREGMRTGFLDLYGLPGDKVVNKYIQTQMLLCIRGAQLLERGESISMFADFGRFYAWRVEELFEEMNADPDFAQGLAQVFEETPGQFFERLDARMKAIRLRMWNDTGHYEWESITGWHPDEPKGSISIASL